MNKSILSPVLVHELLKRTPLPIELARLIQDYLPIHIVTFDHNNQLSTMDIQASHPQWTDWFQCTNSLRIGDQYVFVTDCFCTNGMLVNMDQVSSSKRQHIGRAIRMAVYNNELYIQYSNCAMSYNPLTFFGLLVNPNINNVVADFATCIIHQNYLYVLGGYRHYNASSYCDRFDLQTCVWEDISKLNEPRADAQTIIVDNQIVVMGGWIFYYGNHQYGYTNTVEYYDIQKNKWTIANWRLPLEITVFCAYLIPYTNQLVISQNKKNWIRSLHCDFVSDDWKELSF